MARFTAAGHRKVGEKYIGQRYINLDKAERLDPVPGHSGYHYEAFDSKGERLGIVESPHTTSMTVPNLITGLSVLIFGRGDDTCGTNGVWVTRLPIIAWRVTYDDDDRDGSVTPITLQRIDRDLWAIELPEGTDVGHGGRYIFPDNMHDCATLEEAIAYVKKCHLKEEQRQAEKRQAENAPLTT